MSNEDRMRLLESMRPFVEYVTENLPRIERALDTYIAWGIERAQHHANTATEEPK